MKKIKKETKRHVDAFNYYLKLGKERRSLAKVSKKFGVSDVTISKWSKSFDWQKRIAKADKKIVEATQEKAMELICQNRNWLLEAKNTVLIKALEDIEQMKKDKKIIPAKHIKPIWEMVKTELGEPTSINKNENENKNWTLKELLEHLEKEKAENDKIEAEVIN